MRGPKPILLLVLFTLAMVSSPGFAKQESAPDAKETNQKSELPPQEEPDEESSAQGASAQSAEPLGEMELIVRVEELQEELASKRIPVREAAEKELLKHGPRVLDYLEISEDVMSDTRERYNRIRAQLEKQAIKAVTRSSKLTIQGEYEIAEVFEMIKLQTENDVKFVDGVPETYMKQKIDLDVENEDFWPTLKSVFEKGKLVVAPYSGGPGELRVAPIGDEQPEGQAVKARDVPAAQGEIFDLEVARVVSSRNIANPASSHTTILMRVRWEPRIQPISVVLPLERVKALDEFGEVIEVSNIEAVVAGNVQPEIPELEFSIPFKLIDRQVEEIQSIAAVIDAILPGRVETFRFKNLGDTPVGREIDKAGVIVGFGGISKNDDLYSVKVQVGFDETNEATESYQGWLYQNQATLVDADGNSHDYLSLASGGLEDGKTNLFYYFDVDPKSCSLVYKSPAAIVRRPVKIKIEKIPLP